MDHTLQGGARTRPTRRDKSKATTVITLSNTELTLIGGRYIKTSKVKMTVWMEAHSLIGVNRGIPLKLFLPS